MVERNIAWVWMGRRMFQLEAVVQEPAEVSETCQASSRRTSDE